MNPLIPTLNTVSFPFPLYLWYCFSNKLSIFYFYFLNLFSLIIFGSSFHLYSNCSFGIRSNIQYIQIPKNYCFPSLFHISKVVSSLVVVYDYWLMVISVSHFQVVVLLSGFVLFYLFIYYFLSFFLLSTFWLLFLLHYQFGCIHSYFLIFGIVVFWLKYSNVDFLDQIMDVIGYDGSYCLYLKYYYKKYSLYH